MSYGTISFKGRPYVYREVGKYMIGTEALNKAIMFDYDEGSKAVDELFAGFVTEDELYTGTDDWIIEILDLEEEE